MITQGSLSFYRNSMGPQKQHGPPRNSVDPPELRCTQWACDFWACDVDGAVPRSVATLSKCDDRCMMGLQM